MARHERKNPLIFWQRCSRHSPSPAVAHRVADTAKRTAPYLVDANNIFQPARPPG